MTPELLAGLWLVLGATALSSKAETLKYRSYSGSDGYGGNGIGVSPPTYVPQTTIFYRDPSAYDRDPDFYNTRDSSAYYPDFYDGNTNNNGGNFNSYLNSFTNGRTNSIGDVNNQVSSEQTNSYAQDRFHPTTFDHHSHQVVVRPSNTNNKGQDSVGSASDVQNAFLQPPTNFGIGQDTSPSSSLQEQQFDYQLPSPSYDYQSPPLHPYYYYQQHTTPDIYLPPPPPPPSSPPPEDNREVAYTYFYLGQKLWVIPLLFSVYYVIYVGALIVKSIARHKLLFPLNINSASSSLAARHQRDLDHITDRVSSALATAAFRYFR